MRKISPSYSHSYNLKILEEEYARSEALFSSIGLGAVSTDHSGRINRINDTALEILGYTKQELLGKWFPKAIVAVNGEDGVIKPFDRIIIASLLHGKPVSETLYYKTKSGSKIPVSATVSPIILDGKPIGAVEVFRDISLEHEVDKMKSEFISIASHQLRTPLTAINTYAHMLNGGFQGELKSGQKSFVNIILTSVTRMNELINSLLDIAQLEAGKMNVNMQNLDAAKIVKNLVQEHKQTAVAKNLQFTAKIPPKRLMFRSDPLLLGEVYSNLISNAIKYTPEGGKVKVVIDRIEDEIVFRVADSGYDIPKDLQSRIFTKFFRADNVRQIDTTGTGLGLYMVMQIARVLGGRLWFKSRENKGSSFYFALPTSKKR